EACCKTEAASDSPRSSDSTLLTYLINQNAIHVLNYQIRSAIKGPSGDSDDGNDSSQCVIKWIIKQDLRE
ncbi:11370_t:CDS:2, partial [Ambispora gerdemannii]